MKKLLTIGVVLTLILTLAACGANETKNTGTSDNRTVSEEKLTQVNEENTENDMQEDINESVTVTEGLPEGFPQSMPIYRNAQILEADTYGEHGYTLIYMVSAPYDSVVSFYQKAFPGVEKEYDEPDECYFENFDIDGGKVHINGLTITDDGDYTTVFITLKYN